MSMNRIVASTLMRRLLTEAMARDADIRPRIDALLGRCQIDLPRDLTDVTIAKGAATDEVAILAAGHFDAKAIVACVHAEVNDAGSAFRQETVAGRTVFDVGPQGAATGVFITVATGQIVIATSGPFLRAILDARTEKLAARPDLVALLGGVDQTLAVWGVGFVPPEAGARLVEIAAGAVAEPARTVSFELRVDDGLGLRVRFDMATPADAQGLATFASRQMDLLAAAAQRFNLGRVLAQTKITSDGASLKVALDLADADVRLIEAVVAGTASQAKNEEKEQVR